VSTSILCRLTACSKKPEEKIQDRKEKTHQKKIKPKRAEIRYSYITICSNSTHTRVRVTKRRVC